MCVCVCVWVYGCMGVWVYGCVGVWVYGCMGVWVPQTFSLCPMLCRVMTPLRADGEGNVWTALWC